MANDAPSPALPRSSNLDPVDDQRQCGWMEGAWSAILFWRWSGGVSSQRVWLSSARWLCTAWYKPDKISKKINIKGKKTANSTAKKKKKSESMKYDATQQMHRKSQILDGIFNIIGQVHWLLHCHVGSLDQFALHFISLMHVDFTYALLINPLWGHQSISIDSDLGVLLPYFLVVIVTVGSPFFACMQLKDKRCCWSFEKTFVL